MVKATAISVPRGILNRDGEAGDDDNYRIKSDMMKWKNAFRVLCDRPIKLNENRYRVTI